MIAQDLKFLEDQRCGRKMELGSLNKEYYMKVIRQREELQRDEREHCRLTKKQTINACSCLFDGNDGYAEDAESHDPDFRTSLGGGQLRHSTDTYWCNYVCSKALEQHEIKFDSLSVMKWIVSSIPEHCTKSAHCTGIAY